AFQADDEGSIPFTRSNGFKDLPSRSKNFLTKILTRLLPFTPFCSLGCSELVVDVWLITLSLVACAAFAHPRRPASSCAWRRSAVPWPTYVVRQRAFRRR